ncbi:MAG: SoxR reducing system RseC family protein, partial [Clostridia bacterium]|nr:SoxR reducing system RseC family protein [Clostridia bacterium]
ELDLQSNIDVGVGDFVRVEVYRKKVRVMSVLLYFIPLLLTALGAGLGTLMSLGASIILGLAGLIVGLACAVPIDVCVVRKKSGFSPHIIGICTEADYTQAINDQRAKAIKDSEAEKTKKK